MMKIEGKLEQTDYLNATLLHLQPTGVARILLYAILSIVGFFVVVLIYMTALNELPVGLMIPGLFLAAFVALYRYVLIPNQVKKIFNQQKNLSLPFELEITDAGLVGINELGKSTQPWNHFVKWKENKDLLILYHSDALYSMIPKRLCTDSSQVESIKMYLKSNNVPMARNSRLLTGCIVYFILILIAGWILYVNMRQAVGP